VAESHGGGIRVQSALGTGSSFTVHLPSGPMTEVTTRPRF